MGNAPQPAWLTIDQYVDAFEAAKNQGLAAEISQFAPADDHPLYHSILCELVRVDLEYAWSAGNQVGLDVYRGRFPQLFADPDSRHKLSFEFFRQQLEHLPEPRLKNGEQADGPPASQSSQIASWRAELETLRRDSTWRGGSAATHTDWPRRGEILRGFEILGELGRGAFARVYLAHQRQLARRPVVLKVSLEPCGESQVLAQLQHTNIVPIYSAHPSPYGQVVCMPYFGATTLADVLVALRKLPTPPRNGSLFVDVVRRRAELAAQTAQAADSPGGPIEWQGGDPAELHKAASPFAAWTHLAARSHVDAVLSIGAELADGLAHAHARGICHCDLKPANILLADEGPPMLLDFNLSLDLKPADMAGIVRLGGSLPYMAPEQVRRMCGESVPIDGRADLYALGLILLKLLCRRPAFETPAGNPAEVLAQLGRRHQRRAVLVRQVEKDVPRGVSALIARCLEPDPALRYPSAAALRDDLRRQLDHLPLRGVADVHPAERLGKWCRRHPRLASGTVVGGVAAVLLAIAIAGAAMARSRWQTSQQRLAVATAQENLRAFQGEKEAIEVLFAVQSVELDGTREGLERGRVLLERFGLADLGATDCLPCETFWSGVERAVFRRDAGELWFLMGRARREQAEAAGSPELRAQALNEALDMQTRSLACYSAGAGPRVIAAERAELAGLVEGVLGPSADEGLIPSPPGGEDEFLTAWDLAAEGRLRDAIELLERALEATPQRYAAWLSLGNCHYRTGNMRRAEACYATCVALRPDLPWGYFNRGLCRLEGRAWTLAEHDFDALLSRRSNLPAAYLNRALAKEGFGDLRGAVADLTTALDCGATYTRIYLLRARILARLGVTARAESDRRTGLRLEPSDETSWVARGVAQLPDNPQGALADFERALAMNGRCRDALQNKAHVLSEILGEASAAIEALDLLLSFEPDFVPALGGRGVLRARQGQRATALADARRCLELTDRPDARYQVAGIYALTSRQAPEDAREALRLLADALRRDGRLLEWLARDRDLDPVRDHAEFSELVEAARRLHGVERPGEDVERPGEIGPETTNRERS